MQVALSGTSSRRRQPALALRDDEATSRTRLEHWPSNDCGYRRVGRVHRRTSKMTSSSTGTPSGKLATPKTRRLEILSSPKTSLSSSDAASATRGCSRTSPSVAIDTPSRTTLDTRSSVPKCLRATARTSPRRDCWPGSRCGRRKLRRKPCARRPPDRHPCSGRGLHRLFLCESGVPLRQDVAEVAAGLVDGTTDWWGVRDRIEQHEIVDGSVVADRGHSHARLG